MKKIAKYTAIAALAIGFAGCNDSFLDKAPTTTISEVTAFESYKSTQAYMWPCYAILYNTTIATSPNDHGYASVYNGDRNAGYFSNRTPGGYNAYAFQTVAPSSSGNGWDFGWIYHINIMLKGLETSSMPTAEKEHWQAVGYFFHAFWYMELINRFGDVPWIDKVLNPDTDEPYGPRTPRDEVANNILTAWREYSDESVGILAHTGDTPHNTVTPILHYDETDGYILDLALRNNRTSEEYPDGIFHPHREYHNIKKENIGLIEVMGLAILPARLKDQGAQIAEILAGQRPNTSREAGDTLAVHADWIDELIAKYGTHMKPQDANKAVKAEIGTVFSHVLENAGVFKQDAQGQAAFVRFMQSVGFKKV